MEHPNLQNELIKYLLDQVIQKEAEIKELKKSKETRFTGSWRNHPNESCQFESDQCKICGYIKPTSGVITFDEGEKSNTITALECDHIYPGFSVFPPPCLKCGSIMITANTCTSAIIK